MPKATTPAQEAAGYGMATREQAIALSVRTHDKAPEKKLGFNYETSQASGGKKMKREDVFLILGEDFYTIVFEDTSDTLTRSPGGF